MIRRDIRQAPFSPLSCHPFTCVSHSKWRRSNCISRTYTLLRISDVSGSLYNSTGSPHGYSALMYIYADVCLWGAIKNDILPCRCHKDIRNTPHWILAQMENLLVYYGTCTLLVSSSRAEGFIGGPKNWHIFCQLEINPHHWEDGTAFLIILIPHWRGGPQVHSPPHCCIIRMHMGTVGWPPV